LIVKSTDVALAADQPQPYQRRVPPPKYRLKLLGRFELSGPEGPIELPHKKLVALLAYLACSGPKPQSREKLATLLWGSHFEAQARQNLRQALSRLRRPLGRDALVGDGDDICLAADLVDCDVVRLEALRDEGRSLGTAADLYHDALLADVTIAEEGWADWLGAERLRLESLAVDVMIRHGEQALQAGDAEAALKAAHRAIGVNGLREDAHRLLVRALVSTGRRAEALKHYQDLAALLKRELDTGPDEATRALVAELRINRPLSPSPAVPSVTAGDDRPGGAERRQLTILACHLADPIALSPRLDPEERRDLVVSFHEEITAVVSRFGGFVAQYLSDGVLVYFGYPQAHEHDPEQAVRAGLAIRDAVAARIGIATGLVVVGRQRGADDEHDLLAGPGGDGDAYVRSPRLLKLTWPLRPITRWSWIEIPNASAAFLTSRVISMSSRDGLGSPDG